MKRLTLLRHGHAEARAEGGDFHRTLSAQGRLEVQRSATALAVLCTAPELILASAAQRTRDSAAVLQEHLRSHAAIETTPKLYHASASTLLEVIQETPDGIGHLLLVGHNPGISELALRWAKRFPAHADFGGFSTAGWCSVVFEVDTWTAISSPSDAVFA